MAGDNFDPKNAMVIPTLMWRSITKKIGGSVGDGSAMRDFAYSRDVARRGIGIISWDA